MVQAPALMQFLIVVLAAWLARQQEAFIEYLKAENRMLKARLGRRRIIFTDAERRSLLGMRRQSAARSSSSWIRSSRPTHCSAGIGN